MIDEKEKTIHKFARENRVAGNLAEALLWNELKNKKFFGVKFTRQKVIDKYIVDFYCHKHGAVIKIDGATHIDKGDYDIIRDKHLFDLKLKVIHFADKEVFNNMPNVLECIKVFLEL